MILGGPAPPTHLPTLCRRAVCTNSLPTHHAPQGANLFPICPDLLHKQNTHPPYPHARKCAPIPAAVPYRIARGPYSLPIRIDLLTPQAATARFVLRRKPLRAATTALRHSSPDCTLHYRDSTPLELLKVRFRIVIP